jgi:hypothetical protein
MATPVSPSAPENGSTDELFGLDQPDQQADEDESITQSPESPSSEGVGEAEDPFDITNLRLPQNFVDQVGVEKVITTVPCRKPNRQEFFRVHSVETFRLETAVFEDQLGRDTYLVTPKLMTGELSGEVKPVCLFTCINRQGDIFLWPAKLSGADGRSNSWNESALQAAKEAESSWIRLAANMNAGYYDTFKASGEIPEPEWPDLSFQELIRLSFQDRMIKSHDHPVLRALRGEV